MSLSPNAGGQASGASSPLIYRRSHKRHKSLEPSSIPHHQIDVPTSASGDTSDDKTEETSATSVPMEKREKRMNKEERPDAEDDNGNDDDEDDNDDNDADADADDDDDDDDDDEKEQEEEDDGNNDKVSDRAKTLEPKNERMSAQEMLSSILGISTEKWPYSNDVLSSTLHLRAEMERTKREEVRLKSIQSSLKLVKLAVATEIPPNLIPYLFVFNEGPMDSRIDSLKEELKSKASTPNTSKGHQTSTSVFKVNIPQQTQFQFHHWQMPEGASNPSSAGATVSSSSQLLSTPNRDAERKRKLEEDTRVSPPQQSHASRSVRPPQRSSGTYSPYQVHRRNQSEANVSQLRSIFENQIHEQQRQGMRPQRTSQPSLRGPKIPPQTSESPFNYPMREVPRPVYYQYPPSHAQPVPLPGVPPQMVSLGPAQGQPILNRPVQYYQPASAFQFPKPPVGPEQAYQSPQTFQSPHQLGPAPPMLRNDGSPTNKKGDVSFLISTPNNPPK